MIMLPYQVALGKLEVTESTFQYLAPVPDKTSQEQLW